MRVYAEAASAAGADALAAEVADLVTELLSELSCSQQGTLMFLA